jgi:hypothetical protein
MQASQTKTACDNYLTVAEMSRRVLAGLNI